MCKKWSLVALVVVLLGPIATLASSPYDRVAYWDDNYPTHWVAEATTVEVRDALEAAGYTVMDADELKTWMDARIADGKLSVVVFCKDVAPETVVETNDETCTLRQYLNAGGKVVFYGDIPFYNQGNPGGGETNWGGNGSVGILGFNASPSGGWDSNQEVTITEEGVVWGLTETWVSVRPGAPDGWENMTFLAMDDNGNVPAYVAHYLPDDTFRGFVRIWDRSSITIVEDLIRVAEYAENVEVAALPVPESDTVDVMRDVVLSWASGSLAASHDVYFGTSFEDVNAATRENPLGVLVSQGQSANTYDPEGLLEFGTTYYWRVDEVNSAPDYTIFRGAVWNFTAEPFAYPVENITVTTNATYEADAGPENTINGSGLDADDQHSIDSSDMFLGRAPGDDSIYLQYEFDGVYKLYELLVWNYNVQFELLLGFGIQNVTVEYSENGADWISLGDVDLNQATANATYAANTTIDFGGVAARYVKLTVNNGFGGMDQYGLSELRFLSIPAQAREPEPADGAADVDVASTLTWRAGRDSVSNEIYLGTDPEALALAGTVEAASFAPGELDLGATYYWQVTEIQETEAWVGPLWSFVAQDYLVVDDFESYNDDDNLIYEAWEDGWINGTGSTVGYFEEPFAEQDIVHSGAQSMPLFYDNAGGAVSETDLALAQNWTTNGIQSLSLYFYGDIDNAAAQLYVKINNTRVDYDGPTVNIRRPAWQLWSIDLSTLGNVSNVNSLTIGIEGAGATGTVYIDDIRLYPEVLDYLSPDITGAGDTVQGVPNDDDWPAAEYPDLAIDDDTATKYLHRKGGAMATGIQVEPLLGSTIVTGLTFTTANDAPTRDPVSFELSGSNASLDGPYTLIASGDIVDFAGATDWPRFTKTETPIEFENAVAYKYYQVVFPTLRGTAETLMQIAEIELLGE
jgi:hypothetical protein